MGDHHHGPTVHVLSYSASDGSTDLIAVTTSHDLAERVILDDAYAGRAIGHPIIQPRALTVADPRGGEPGLDPYDISERLHLAANRLAAAGLLMTADAVSQVADLLGEAEQETRRIVWTAVVMGDTGIEGGV